MKRMVFISVVAIYSVGILFGVGRFASVPFVGTIALSGKDFVALTQCEQEPTAALFDTSEQYKCFSRTLVSMVRSAGLTSATATFRRYLKSPRGEPLRGMRCHALAHEIGNAAARTRVPSDVLASQCVNMCTYVNEGLPQQEIDLGCLNGASHTWVLLSSDVLDVFGKCNIPSMPQWLRNGCYHGIGHGLREKYADNFQAAVVECLRLPNKQARYQCAHAVFMEPNVITKPTTLPVSLVPYCSGLPEEVRKSCFEFVGFMTYSYTKDAQAAMNVCVQVSDPDLSIACRTRVGESLYRARLVPQDIVQCVSKNDTQSTDCVYGFVRSMIDHVNDLYGQGALQACMLLADTVRQECLRGAGSAIVTRFGEHIRTNLCAKLVNEDDAGSCMRGIEP